jgi:CBS domain-containing protein
MQLLHRASPWRGLFSGSALPTPDRLPPYLRPLEDALVNLGKEPDLARAHRWQAELVEALDRLDLPAWRISQVISDHNDWLYRRAIDLSLNEMQGHGWGPPPVAWCVLTMGSVARHESLMAPDQDNAMIIADYPDSRHTEIDGYFQALGERFANRLDEAGIPLCQGQVMARWPMWRKRLGEWTEQLTIWTRGRQVKRVQQANILLDFHPVHGDASLAAALSETVTRLVTKASLFLDEMGALLEELPVALDRFGRLAGNRDGAPHDRAIDLKHQGVLPLVNAVRLLALRQGITPPDTHSRLTALVMCEALQAKRARGLRKALERLQELLLDEQRRALQEGRTPDGWVDIDRLGEDQTLMLRHDLQQIRGLMRHARKA